MRVAAESVVTSKTSVADTCVSESSVAAESAVAAQTSVSESTVAERVAVDTLAVAVVCGYCVSCGQARSVSEQQKSLRY